MYTYNIYTYVFTFKDAVSRSLSSLLFLHFPFCCRRAICAQAFNSCLYISCLLTQGRGFAILVLFTFSYFTFLLPRALCAMAFTCISFLLPRALCARMQLLVLFTFSHFTFCIYFCCPALYAPWPYYLLLLFVPYFPVAVVLLLHLLFVCVVRPYFATALRAYALLVHVFLSLSYALYLLTLIV